MQMTGVCVCVCEYVFYVYICPNSAHQHLTISPSGLLNIGDAGLDHLAKAVTMEFSTIDAHYPLNKLVICG